MSSPKRNVAYEFDIALIDSATGDFKASPTIAAGDFKVSTDNAAFGNLATLPVVSPAASIVVKLNLSAPEMNGDKIMVQAIDAAGDEWDDVLIFIDATTANVDDVVRATTPANTLDVDASGDVTAESVVGAVGSVTGHTAQTGDSFARIGAAGASLSDLGGMSTTMKGQVNTEADTALTDFLAVAVAASNTAGTVGDCLNAARAQGFGKWSLDAVTRVLTLYGADDSTVVQTLTIGPNLVQPLTRTP